MMILISVKNCFFVKASETKMRKKTEQKGHFQIDFNNFQNLYDLYYESLCEYLNFFTKDIHIIEDTVQEVFMYLWENREVVEINHVKTYLFRSARNKMLNHFRDQKIKSVFLENWFENQLENIREQKDAFNTEQLLSAIQKSIDALPPKCRELFILSKFEGLTYKQIAELKEVSIKTVENQMGIALKKIREYLKANHLYLYPILASIFS